jgi:B12-binding domain/radical SAM domain protein of rhizo-twelve system
MRIVLCNPRWHYEGSVYFGCREPHLTLELAYARTLLEWDGHTVTLVDAHAEQLSGPELGQRVTDLRPEMIVLTTAPSYLFWRCPPPELRVPMEALRDLRQLGCPKIAVGPHASTSPASTLSKLKLDAVVVGECEEVVQILAATPRSAWPNLPHVVTREGHPGRVRPALSHLERLPSLRWFPSEIARHSHHHHRFDGAPEGLGAEVEASRGCPFGCTFCAKELHRNGYRRRSLDVVLVEIDALLSQGVRYLYFIDEIFLPDDQLLAELTSRRVRFGMQTRIDLWDEAHLDELGHAGCVSIEAGIESVTDDGRAALRKNCRLHTDDLIRRLVRARHSVPFVQATLMQSRFDPPAEVQAFRTRMQAAGIWVNDPVPAFPYPGSPDYRLRWGHPDGRAWERAHEDYLARNARLCELQSDRPLPLATLEAETIE